MCEVERLRVQLRFYDILVNGCVRQDTKSRVTVSPLQCGCSREFVPTRRWAQPTKCQAAEASYDEGQGGDVV